MLFIYLLLTIIILALALAPTLFNNPVRSVISFIAVFLLVAGILLSINIEFLAFVYAIVYIGAVAVLFLFIVMLLKVSTKYHPAFHSSWILILAIFLIYLTFQITDIIVTNFSLYHLNKMSDLLPATPFIETIVTGYPNANNSVMFNELHQIAQNLYSIFSMLFLETAYVLLIALIAVIVLTKGELKSTL